MQAAFDYAVEYVHEREQFGKAVGTFQLMQGLFSSRLNMNSAKIPSAKIAGRSLRRF
jgi:isovaleryl-CoA dehydrogenase